LHNLEEAKKRDHRKLGKELDLFTFSPLIGSGLPLFTPRGTVIRTELEKLVQSLQEPLGYERVFIPHIAKADVYQTSGHWDKFKDDLFHVKGKGDDAFVLKPMNCPHHTQIYASRPRSYRDLPLRFSEVTTCYRDELPGELQGLSRVRGFTQDDAHVFCRPDQIEAEIERVYSIVKSFYACFSFSLSVRLSLRDPAAAERYLGDDALWEQAEGVLRGVLQKKQVDFAEAAGEAAFYGPKIDFIATDSLDRQWQLATIQLDFNQPERFGLTYTAADGGTAQPVMIHRAVLGSVERFMAILIEHYAGKLPLWLSPTHVAVLPLSDAQNAFAEQVQAQLREAHIRAECDSRSESIGKKIRETEIKKVPLMAVIGKREEASGTISVRSRSDKKNIEKTIAEFIAEVRERIAARTD
jgi:threonyl-tRNA synthetase